jgi:hypothetical protein
LAILVYGFKYLGRARLAAAKEKDKKTALFLWALGSALFANVIAFLGISYFDQTMVGWYALLAMIPAAIAVRPKKQLTPEPLAAPAQEPSLAAPVPEDNFDLDAQPYLTQ